MTFVEHRTKTRIIQQWMDSHVLSLPLWRSNSRLPKRSNSPGARSRPNPRPPPRPPRPRYPPRLLQMKKHFAWYHILLFKSLWIKKTDKWWHTRILQPHGERNLREEQNLHERHHHEDHLGELGARASPHRVAVRPVETMVAGSVTLEVFPLQNKSGFLKQLISNYH